MKSSFAVYNKKQKIGSITTADISVVVQGAVSPLTGTCLKTIRENLPKAQIILSTWKGTDTRNLSYDELVLSEDPGAMPLVRNDPKHLNNLNRQLVSTQNGLKKASRKYVLKIRSDVQLTTDKFITAYEKYSAPAWHFHSKVLIVDYYSRNPNVVPVPYHPSDWMMFGENADVAAYYNVPLMPPKYMNYFSTHDNMARFFREVLHLYTPEQWICYQFLCKKNEKIQLKSYYDNSSKNRNFSLKMFRDDFIIVNAADIGLHFNKYNPNRSLEHFMLISHQDWLHLQKDISAVDVYTIVRKNIFNIRCAISILLERLRLKNTLHSFLKTIRDIH